MHLLAWTSSKRSSNWGDEEKVSNVEDEFKKEKEGKKKPLTPLKLTQKLGYKELTGGPFWEDEAPSQRTQTSKQKLSRRWFRPFLWRERLCSGLSMRGGSQLQGSAVRPTPSWRMWADDKWNLKNLIPHEALGHRRDSGDCSARPGPQGPIWCQFMSVELLNQSAGRKKLLTWMNSGL